MKWKIITVLFVLALFLPALAPSQTMGKYRGKLDRPAKDSSRYVLGGPAEEDKTPFSTAPEDQKSTADIQRDEQIKQLKIQASQKAEEKRLASDPKYYFEKKIKGYYGLLDGQPVRLKMVAGEVLQILNEKTIVLSQAHVKYLDARGMHGIMVRDAPIVVVLTNTQGIVDGMSFRQKVTPTGTHPDKTGGTLAKYAIVPDITYDQFLNLRAQGITF